MSHCKVCGKETETVYNINFKATPICDHCGRAIAFQEISAMFEATAPNITPKEE